jgi:hypothetical protein
MDDNDQTDITQGFHPKESKGSTGARILLRLDELEQAVDALEVRLYALDAHLSTHHAGRHWHYTGLGGMSNPDEPYPYR